MQAAVARASSRVFVGVPLCEHVGSFYWMAECLHTLEHSRPQQGLSQAFYRLYFSDERRQRCGEIPPRAAQGVRGDLHMLYVCPDAGVDRAIRFMSVARKTIRGAIPHLKPIVDERKKRMEELGDDWADKPVSDAVFVVYI